MSAGTLSLSNTLTMGSTITNYFELNTATTVGGGVNDLVNVGGNLDPQNARVFVTALSAFTTGSPYRLFNYGGAKPSSFNPTVLTDTHYTFSLDETVANQINVTVNAGPNLVWSGTTRQQHVGPEHHRQLEQRHPQIPELRPGYV